MKGKNLPVLFLYKNKKRGDLVNVWAMGWGWGSLLRSDSLARCEKQKDKRLWTDYSRLDIMHHLRYDGTYRLGQHSLTSVERPFIFGRISCKRMTSRSS